MKRILSFLLLAAFLLTAASCCKNEAPAQKGALEVIKARTSIRAFTGEKLSEEQINKIGRASCRERV